MDNPEKLAKFGTRRQTKHKNTTQYVLDTTIHKQTQITYIRHEPSYKQLQVYYSTSMIYSISTSLIYFKIYSFRIKLIIWWALKITFLHLNLDTYNKMKSNKYHTVGTAAKYHTVGTSPKYHTVVTSPKYHTVGTSPKYHTVGTSPKYHTVGTAPKYHTVGTSLKYHTVGTAPKSNDKIVERDNTDTPYTQYMTTHFSVFLQAIS